MLKCERTDRGFECLAKISTASAIEPAGISYDDRTACEFAFNYFWLIFESYADLHVPAFMEERQ